MTVAKELLHLVRPLKMEKYYRHTTHIVLFTTKEEEMGPQHILCHEEQLDELVDFLLNHKNVEYARAIELGRVEFELNKKEY